MLRRSAVQFAAVIAFVLAATAAQAADVRVMISSGFFHVYSELGPAYEKATGNHLVTTRGPSLGDSPEAIPTRLARGEEADVVIMDGHGADMLDQKQMTKPGSRINLAESFIGMVARSGQPKPDISTTEGLRKALLAAKSVAVSDSSSGTYLSTVGFKKLGVAEEVAKKLRKVRGPPSGEPVAAVIARGEAEIGFQQVAELIHTLGVDFVGALPAKAKQPEAAVALLRFLSSAEAAPIITKAGLKPLAPK